MIYKQLVLVFNTTLPNNDEYRKFGFINHKKEYDILFNDKLVGKTLKLNINRNELFVLFDVDINIIKKKLFICPDFTINASYNNRKKTWSDYDLRKGKEFKRRSKFDSYVFLNYEIKNFVLSKIPLIECKVEEVNNDWNKNENAKKLQVLSTV